MTDWDPALDGRAASMQRWAAGVMHRAQREREERAVIDAILATVKPDPLPALPRIAYPKKLAAESIAYDAAHFDGAIPDLVRELEAKLAAEAARIRRLLPPPLPGHEWRGEIASDVEYDFADFTARDTIRLRYRLVEIGARRYRVARGMIAP